MESIEGLGATFTFLFPCAVSAQTAYRECASSAVYVLDAQRHELRQQGVPVPLEHKAYQVLVYLVQHADRLATKAELLEAVWPTVYVNDSAVALSIGAVRQAVGDTF